jgi:hypothetical protein
MRRSPKPAEAVRAEATPLPFSGLGHSLADVAWAAANMTLRPARRPDERDAFALGSALPRPVSGYGLLVALGREIRGR